MKRFYYESKLAKILLAFSSCHTIAIGPFVLSKRSKEKCSQESRNHETIHAIQWIEITIVVGLILLLFDFIFNFHPAWYLLSGVIYYVVYGLEWVIKLFIHFDTKKAYRALCFEREAYYNEDDDNYIENRELFAWKNLL